MLSVDFITNSVFNSRTYILSDEKYDSVWLVDCGDTERVLDILKGKKIDGVLLTHTHSDHIYGLVYLMNLYPKVKIYTNAFGLEALCSPKLNLSHYHSEYPDIEIRDTANVYIISERDTIDLLGYCVQVYDTIGHDPSCLTYLVDKWAFTGDSYIPGQKVFTGFPYSNKIQALDSLDKIKIITSHYIIMPGHTIN